MQLMLSLAQNCTHDPVDVIVGDWLSEGNMASAVGRKLNLKTSTSRRSVGYETSFLKSLRHALPCLVQHKIRAIANAGGSATEKLKTEVVSMVERCGYKFKVACIEGDEILDKIQHLQNSGVVLDNICTGESLRNWEFDPFYAQW